MRADFSILNKTGIRLPRLPFLLMKNDILGKSYSISIAFIDEKSIQKINKTYRKKDKPTNVLSFGITKNSGELLLCPSLIKKESLDENKNFGKNFTKLLGFLVIHGMLHLKGLDHGSIMEEQESKYDQKYFYRNRRRIQHDQSRGGRISKRRKNS
jgi:rRNA maturation RNase YbeY